MKRFAVLLLLLIAGNVRADVGPVQTIEPSAGMGITDDIDAAFSGTDFVIAWRESRGSDSRIVVQRVAPTGQPGPRVEVTGIHRSWGGVSVAAVGSLILVGWRDCSGMKDCPAKLAWVERDVAGEPFELDVSWDSWIPREPSIDLTWDGSEFVAAWDHVATASSVGIARIRPGERTAQVELVPVPQQPFDVVTASVGERRIFGWTRLDPATLYTVCGLCSLELVPWMATGRWGEHTIERLVSWNLGKSESAVAIGANLVLCHSSLFDGDFELRKLPSSGAPETAMFNGFAPRLDVDADQMVLLRAVTGKSGSRPRLLVSRFSAAGKQPVRSLAGIGGFLVAELAAGSSYSESRQAVRVAAGGGRALALYRNPLRASSGPVRLYYRIADFVGGRSTPPPPEQLSIGGMQAAPKTGVTLSWRDPSSAAAPLKYRLVAAIADEPDLVADGELDRAGAVFLSDLKPDTPYLVEVQSEDDVGLSDPARLEFRTPAYGVPRAVSDVSVAWKSDGSAVVMWHDRSTSEQGFRIYGHSGDTRLLGEAAADATALTIPVDSRRWAYYSVRPFNQAGEGAAVYAAAPSRGRMRAAGK